MKHQNELTKLINDIRTCAIDTQAECMAMLDEQHKKGYSFNMDNWDATPFLRPDNTFWELWKANNIEERIKKLLSVQFFEDEPQNAYQTEKRNNLLTGFILEMMDIGGMMQVYFFADNQTYEVYKTTYCQLLANIMEEQHLLQQMVFDDWDEENRKQATPTVTKAIQPEPTHQPVLTEHDTQPDPTETATEPMQGKAKITDWLMDKVDYDEERAETIVNRLNLIPTNKRTPKAILKILDQENVNYKIDFCLPPQLADELTECTGVKVTPQALQRYKPEEYKERKNK